MEHERLYVIDEKTRQSIIAVISKAIHPNIAYDQIEMIKHHLMTLTPVETAGDIDANTKKPAPGTLTETAET